MSADLLAKLRVKNQPVKIETVEVIVKRGAQRQVVALKTKIEDKRDTVFNRTQFLDVIADKFQTKQKIPKQTLPNQSLPMIPIGEEPIQQDATIAEPGPPKVTKKPKKLKKKLKLVPKVQAKPLQKRKRKSPIGVARVLPDGLVQIGDTPMVERLGKQKPNVLIKASSYYMNNREIFINFINSIFSPYKAELLEASTTASNKAGLA